MGIYRPQPFASGETGRWPLSNLPCAARLAGENQLYPVAGVTCRSLNHLRRKCLDLKADPEAINPSIVAGTPYLAPLVSSPARVLARRPAHGMPFEVAVRAITRAAGDSDEGGCKSGQQAVGPTLGSPLLPVFQAA